MRPGTTRSPSSTPKACRPAPSSTASPAGPVEAALALDRGCLLSFSGIVTFPSATDLQAAAVVCPLDRLMVETDAPYLAPVPHRGKRNQPAWVVDVAAKVAELQGRSIDEVADATWRTTERFYGLA